MTSSTAPVPAGARAGSPLAGIALSTLVVAVVAGVVNLGIALAARGLGADPTVVGGLAPAVLLPFTVVGALAGAVGWHLVRRRAADPARTLSWLVPLVVGISLVPDVVVAVAAGAVGGVALGLMHLVVLAAALPTYRRFLPLPAGSPRRAVR